jgi:hypothetical protein
VLTKQVDEEVKSPPNRSIFSLTEFIETADELLLGRDLTAEQYITVVWAIYSGHAEVEKLFDLHGCPDFLLACDSEDFRLALLMRDLLSLGKTLPLITVGPSDELLKWAIHTGLHNFSETIATEMPSEFKTIIYHMFSSGDEFVLSACKVSCIESNVTTRK